MYNAYANLPHKFTSREFITRHIRALVVIPRCLFLFGVWTRAEKRLQIKDGLKLLQYENHFLLENLIPFGIAQFSQGRWPNHCMFSPATGMLDAGPVQWVSGSVAGYQSSGRKTSASRCSRSLFRGMRLME